MVNTVNSLTKSFKQFSNLVKDNRVTLSAGQRNSENSQEDLLEEILESNGFARGDVAMARTYRKQILDPLNENYPTTDLENWFVPQPFGSQSFPDFLIGFNGWVIPVELKSNKSENSTPFWNGHIPTALGVYLVTDGKPEATYFRGEDYINPEERKCLLNLRDQTLNLSKGFDQKDLSMKFRVRVAYDSNQDSPFTHEDRITREKNVQRLFSLASKNHPNAMTSTGSIDPKKNQNA